MGEQLQKTKYNTYKSGVSNTFKLSKANKKIIVDLINTISNQLYQTLLLKYIVSTFVYVFVKYRMMDA